MTEVFLYIWIAAFAYDEFGEFKDAGVAFYQTDFWSLWDLGIIITGIAFLIIRKSSTPPRYLLRCGLLRGRTQ